MKKISDIIGRPVGAFSQQFPGTPAEQADALVAHGLDCVQWQPGPDALTSNDAARREIENFRRAGLPIVAVSGYNNLVARDPAQKAAALAAVERALELAALVGPGIGVATETGTKHSETAWISDPANLLPATWEEMLDAVAGLQYRAAALGGRLLLEGYVENVVRTAADIARARRDPRLEGVGFVMDPFNLILEADVPRQQEEMKHIFEETAGLTPVAHAKDLLYTDGIVSTPRTGTGIFDYPAYFRLLDANLPGVPLILEHLGAEEVPAALDYLCRTYVQSLD